MAQNANQTLHFALVLLFFQKLQIKKYYRNDSEHKSDVLLCRELFFIEEHRDEPGEDDAARADKGEHNRVGNYSGGDHNEEVNESVRKTAEHH